MNWLTVTLSAKRCRAERGQVIAVHNGVVKDLTNLPHQEQQRILQTSQSDRPREEFQRSDRALPSSEQSYQLVLNELPQSGQSTAILRTASQMTIQQR